MSMRSTRRMVHLAAFAAACVLFAAPLQADHETLNVTVTLEATPGDGRIALQASQVSVAGVAGVEFTGYQFRGQRNGAWDDSWWHMASDGTSTVWDLTNGTAYTFQARAYKASISGGTYHYAYSAPSAAVTVTPAASAE